MSDLVGNLEDRISRDAAHRLSEGIWTFAEAVSIVIFCSCSSRAFLERFSGCVII